MDGESRCWVCGEVLSKGAPNGLCPDCSSRQGLLGAGSLAGDPIPGHGTGSFEPIVSGAPDTLDAGPRVHLRDAEAETGPEPPIRADSSEMPGPDDRSDRFELIGEIARGGMGAVLKGRDPNLGRDLVVKVLLEKHRSPPELVRRFVEEAQIAGQLQHPGIVPVYEMGTFADQRPYFAMKLVKGHTLARMLKDRPDPAYDLPTFIGIFEAVCQTMAYTHSRGVIHRDLKPSNVMVGSFGEVQVMDWSLAKVLPRRGVTDDKATGVPPADETIIATARSRSRSDHTETDGALGTPSYMAPEQARGEVEATDERSDVSALGSILPRDALSSDVQEQQRQMIVNMDEIGGRHGTDFSL
jgi:serine/threonine protein kinase